MKEAFILRKTTNNSTVGFNGEATVGVKETYVQAEITDDKGVEKLVMTDNLFAAKVFDTFGEAAEFLRSILRQYHALIGSFMEIKKHYVSVLGTQEGTM